MFSLTFVTPISVSSLLTFWRVFSLSPSLSPLIMTFDLFLSTFGLNLSCEAYPELIFVPYWPFEVDSVCLSLRLSLLLNP